MPLPQDMRLACPTTHPAAEHAVALLCQRPGPCPCSHCPSPPLCLQIRAGESPDEATAVFQYTVYNQLKPMVDDNNNKIRKVRSEE